MKRIIFNLELNATNMHSWRLPLLITIITYSVVHILLVQVKVVFHMTLQQNLLELNITLVSGKHNVPGFAFLIDTVFSLFLYQVQIVFFVSFGNLRFLLSLLVLPALLTDLAQLLINLFHFNQFFLHGWKITLNSVSAYFLLVNANL